MEQDKFNILSWLIMVISLLLAIFAWGSRVEWQIGSITTYQWFPLFGLTAWMTMWGHYATGAIRLSFNDLKKPKYYGRITGWIVLLSLFLHPALLAYEQYNNDQGLPPESFQNYVVSDSLALAVSLGTIALIIFLSFEIFDRIKDRPSIKKFWPIISISQSLAMILIFVHALRLGSDLGDGWFRVVWILYGLALIPCFWIIHKNDFKST